MRTQFFRGDTPDNEAYRLVSRMLIHDSGPFALVSEDGTRVELPDEFVHMLGYLMADLSAGHTVWASQIPPELPIQEAFASFGLAWIDYDRKRAVEWGMFPAEVVKEGGLVSLDQMKKALEVSRQKDAEFDELMRAAYPHENPSEESGES